MAIPILKTWKQYFTNPHEGLGSSYERIVLNDLLLYLKRIYRVESVLEAPIFGFTGLTGLNSIALAQNGCSVTLAETDGDRAQLVTEMLKPLELPLSVDNIRKYTVLPYKDKEFDFSWNFSAMWFVEDLQLFLAELSRVTSKVILICVPNQSGLGYKWQKAHAEIPLDVIFNESYINPEQIKTELKKLNWQFVQEAYIDCPLWPDIGMNKESFFKKILASIPVAIPFIKKVAVPFTGTRFAGIKPPATISILGYYKGNDPGFADKMRRYSFLEQWAPVIFRKIWSHHRWMLFTAPDNK
jgi:hypothetical protein